MFLELLALYASLVIAAIALSEAAVDCDFWWWHRKSESNTSTSPSSVFWPPTFETDDRYHWMPAKELCHGWQEYIVPALESYGAELRNQRSAQKNQHRGRRAIFSLLSFMGIRNKRQELEELKLKRSERSLQRALRRHMTGQA